MKCDELEAETIVPQGCTITLQMYPKAEVDAAIAELKARIQLDDDEMAGFLQLEEECGGGDLRNYIAELKAKLDKAIAERDGNQVCIDALNEKLEAKELEFANLKEDALNTDEAREKWLQLARKQAMEIRRLRRALWLTRAERASDKALIFYFAMAESYPLNINGYSDEEKGHTRMRNAIWWRTTWLKVERKCREKAEGYK